MIKKIAVGVIMGIVIAFFISFASPKDVYAEDEVSCSSQDACHDSPRNGDWYMNTHDDIFYKECCDETSRHRGNWEPGHIVPE